MRPLKLYSVIVFTILITSCSPKTFYQVYKVIPSDNLIKIDNQIIFEDENCIVTYNLWKESGKIGFLFTNKTNKNIYINLAESFFIINNYSHSYYKDRIFSNSTSFGATLTKGSTVSYNEEKIVCIPSGTIKAFNEFNITENIYSDCSLFKYPKKNQIKTKTFSKSESPLIFGNRIAYSIGSSEQIISLENEFYVTEIANYPKNEMLTSEYDEYCGQKSYVKTYYLKNVSSDKFYNKYIKSTDTWKH